MMFGLWKVLAGTRHRSCHGNHRGVDAGAELICLVYRAPISPFEAFGSLTHLRP